MTTAPTTSATITTAASAPTDTSPADAVLRQLSELLPRQVITRGDPAWERARLGWSVNVDQRPAAVVTVADAADIATVVNLARGAGLTVTAQPVGHGASTCLTDTVLLRTAALAECSVDPVRRIARVGAGVKWQQLLNAAGAHGLIGLSGSSGDPSVVGFCLGGGLSWFSRAFGLAANSVRAIEVVDADGRQVRTDAEHDPELFWALRGGGGEFGIVTALELQLYPSESLYGGRLLWPLEQAPAVLAAFRQITTAAPDELAVWAHLLRFPPLPMVPEPLQGKAFVSLDFTFLGTPERAEELLAPARALPAPMLDSTSVLAPERLPEIAAEPVDPMPTQHWSALLNDLDDATVERLLAVAGPGATCSLLIVQLRHLGGALARPDESMGAAGAVEQPYELMGLGVPAGPDAAAAVAADLARLAAAAEIVDSGRAVYTFLGADEAPDRAYSPEVLDRLRALKSARDPHRVIGGNHPLGSPSP